jgi:hypothetical protein
VGGFSFVEEGYEFADARIEALRGRRAAQQRARFAAREKDETVELATTR